ncbi:MAG: terminase small subunit [Synechococcus sp.]
MCSPRTARQQGSRLLTRVNIQTALAAEMAPIRERTRISTDRLVRELAANAFSRITDVVSWDNEGIVVKSSSELSEESAIAIQRVTMRETQTKDGTLRVVEVKLHDKLSALEKLCRHIGFYNARPEQAPIKIQIVMAVPDFVEEDERLN